MHPIQEKLLKIISEKNIGDLTLREIGDLIAERLPQKVKHHLLQLERKGFILIDKKNNSISRVIGAKATPKEMFVSLPIVGSANCGPQTIYAEQNIEGYLTISGKLLSKKKDIFAIKASGYSMNKANINGECIEDGDYVVVDPRYRSMKNGDYVLSVIDGVANIKRYFDDKENKRIILLSESSASFSPIFIHYQDLDRYLVNGKIIQVIKRPKTTWSKFKKFVYREAD